MIKKEYNGILSKIIFLIKDSSVYGFGILLSKVFAFILIPFITAHFSVEEFGYIDTFQAIILLFSLILSFGMSQSVGRYFHEYKNLKKRLVSETFFLLLIVIVIYISLYFPVVNYVSNLDNKTDTFKNILRVCYFQIPCMVIFDFSLNLLKYSFKKYLYLIISLGQMLTSGIAVLSGIYFFDLKIINIFKIYLAVYIVFSLLSVYFIREYISFPKKPIFFKKVIIYGLPFLFIALFKSSIPVIERWVISSQIGKVDLGIYALAVKLSFIIDAVALAFHSTWVPFSLTQFKKNNFDQVFNVVLKTFSFGIFSLSLLAGILLPFILSSFFDSNYSNSSQFFYILCISSSINAISAFTDLGILLSKKSIYYLFNSMIFFSVTLVSMYFLIEPFGVIGIVVSALFGNLIKAILGYYIAQKVHKINWNIKPIIYLLILTILISFISTYLDFHNSVYLFLFQSIGLISLLLFFWFYLMNKQEKISLVDVVNKKIKTSF